MQNTFFDASFKDSKFMPAKEKARVLKAWETFLRNGCRQEDFTHALYEHLINHCSFIAHYNRAGFYDTYFVNGEDTAHFLTQFDRSKGCQSMEYGGTGWLTDNYTNGLADINNAMVDTAARYIPLLTQKALEKQRKADIAEARALLGKHGIELKEGK